MRHSVIDGRHTRCLFIASGLVSGIPSCGMAAGYAGHASLGLTQVVQATLVLFGILAFIWILAYFLRRCRVFTKVETNAIRIVTTVSLGVKEKVMLLEVGEQQLLVGVSGAGIAVLHVLTTPVATSRDSGTTFANGFARQLQTVLSQAEKS